MGSVEFFRSAVRSATFIAALLLPHTLMAQGSLGDKTACQSTLEAMHDGEAQGIVKSELQGRKVSDADEQSFLHKAQLGIDKMIKVGGGPPLNKSIYVDDLLEHGNLAEIAEWEFPNGLTSYAGCVRYRDLNGVEVSVTKLNSNLDGLKSEIDYYAFKRIS